VNLERPLTPESRLGGHFVQGHVDTTARLVAVRPEGNARILRFQLDDARYMRYIVPKGSIAVDGISLTVVDVGDDWFTVWIIPHTWDATNLQARRVGERVNIEADILARYVERFADPYLTSPSTGEEWLPPRWRGGSGWGSAPSRTDCGRLSARRPTAGA
jgi:riboflavin synthase alpha subunit